MRGLKRRGKMNKLIKELLKEAHDHGFGIGESNIKWSIEKSWNEFLRQNNIPTITEDEVRDQVAKKAKQMQAQGHSLRDIASVLGYTHPQTIKNMIFWYDKRQKKLNNPH
jgi:prophage antirepressor-like protein